MQTTKERQCISPEVIMIGYKKCHISNAVNVPDMLRNGNKEDGNNRSVRKVKVL